MGLQIYDNTLRDGEQAIGVAYSSTEKKEIIKKLTRIGIKNIEAGFIAVSYDEQLAIRDIVTKFPDVNIFCLARMCKQDIDLAYNNGVRNITIFTCASDELLKYKLKKDESQLLEDIKTCISYCKSKNMFVRFSCEDATRSSVERLKKLYKCAQDYGADFASVPDTSGVATPERIYKLITKLKKEVNIPFSIHCHNDLGLATSNSIAAVLAGVEEVQTTINGIGERAGNTSFEEFVSIMQLIYGINLGVNLKGIVGLSEYVSKISNIPIPVNKPIIGKHVFSHESGLHVKIVNQGNTHCYEPFDPREINRTHNISFGKHSGIANINFLCDKYDIKIDDESKRKVLFEIKNNHIYQKGISDIDVLSIIKHLQ